MDKWAQESLENAKVRTSTLECLVNARKSEEQLKNPQTIPQLNLSVGSLFRIVFSKFLDICAICARKIIKFTC